MLNRLKETNEALKAHAAIIAGLENEKAKTEAAITAIFEDCENTKARLEKRKEAAVKKQLEKLSSDAAGINAAIEKESLYIKALKQIEKNLVTNIIIDNLLDSCQKYDGQPLYYKKIHDVVKAAAPAGYMCYVSNYSGHIEITKQTNTGFYDYEVNKYISCAKLADRWPRAKSDYNFSYEKLATNKTDKIYTPLQVAAQLEKYLEARKAIEAAKEEHEKKLESIKTGAECVGLSWSDNLYYITK